jgi:hypothetical protein
LGSGTVLQNLTFRMQFSASIAPGPPEDLDRNHRASCMRLSPAIRDFATTYAAVQKSHFQPSVKSGIKNIDKNNR